MAGKSNFTPEEWARVAASPIVAGMAITAADPSGLWGLLKESMSGGWALLEAKQDAKANPLVKAVADDIADPATRDAVREAFQERFRNSQLGDAKGKAIAAAFKSWLKSVAERAAEAGTEGGFLGFGGVAVSDAEKATLQEISAALDGSSPPAGIVET